MSGFFRALTGNNLRTGGNGVRRGRGRTERKHGPFGTRRLQMESLEDRRLLTIDGRIRPRDHLLVENVARQRARVYR